MKQYKGLADNDPAVECTDLLLKGSRCHLLSLLQFGRHVCLLKFWIIIIIKVKVNTNWWCVFRNYSNNVQPSERFPSTRWKDIATTSNEPWNCKWWIFDDYQATPTSQRSGSKEWADSAFRGGVGSTTSNCRRATYPRRGNSTNKIDWRKKRQWEKTDKSANEKEANERNESDGEWERRIFSVSERPGQRHVAWRRGVVASWRRGVVASRSADILPWISFRHFSTRLLH